MQQRLAPALVPPWHWRAMCLLPWNAAPLPRLCRCPQPAHLHAKNLGGGAVDHKRHVVSCNRQRQQAGLDACHGQVEGQVDAGTGRILCSCDLRLASASEGRASVHGALRPGAGSVHARKQAGGQAAALPTRLVGLLQFGAGAAVVPAYEIVGRLPCGRTWAGDRTLYQVQR